MEEVTPQGVPLSPLLSNVMLHEMDKELERRGHKFCRYADDCNIYVKSKKAGDRVMESVSEFIEKRLKLKVNREKSAMDSPIKRKFLGFSFYYKEGGARIRVHAKSLKRVKEKLRSLTKRSDGKSMARKKDKLNQVITGWVNYYHLADMESHCQDLDGWVRRRLRMCQWKQWKKIGTKLDNLIRLVIHKSKAWEYANTRKGYWHTSNSPILSRSVTNNYLRSLGFVSLSEIYQRSLSLRTAVCRTARTVV
jgi:RNA-directed DNA polymerase